MLWLWKEKKNKQCHLLKFSLKQQYLLSIYLNDFTVCNIKILLPMYSYKKFSPMGELWKVTAASILFLQAFFMKDNQYLVI